MRLEQRQIQEIAEQLDCGFRAFWHKTTGKLVFIIDSSKFPAADWEEEEEQAQEEIDANRDEYIEIEAMGSNDSYRVMVDFADQLTNPRLQKQLFRALDKRGPFREFKYVIDNSGDYREAWFAFKNQRYLDWVSQQVQVSE
ncbi:UPF0158 family protein [Fibrella arboris]|uniref:UPF0158 family protein n=1 Tax=Fibrella arboris TaxID=3242486 RepID=UPI00352285BC